MPISRYDTYFTDKGSKDDRKDKKNQDKDVKASEFAIGVCQMHETNET